VYPILATNREGVVIISHNIIVVYISYNFLEKALDNLDTIKTLKSLIMDKK